MTLERLIRVPELHTVGDVVAVIEELLHAPA